MLKRLRGFHKKPANSASKPISQSLAATLRNLAFENSLQANVITDAGNGKVAIVNKAACLLLGYSKSELLTKTWSDILEVNQSSSTETRQARAAIGRTATFATGIRKDGKRFPCEITSAVFKGADGTERAIITITRTNQVVEYRQSFKMIFNSSSDVFFDSDLISDKVIVSDAYEKEFGHKTHGYITTSKEWASHISPEDKKKVLRDYIRMLRSDENNWEYSFRFLREDNSEVSVCSNAIVLRDANKKAYRMIGYMHDTSRQVILKERLAQVIQQKEKEIEEAIERAKEIERSEIGKELHDNINQLLGASNLYLNMAKVHRSNKNFLTRCSEYTMMAIEEIRKLAKGLTSDSIKIIGIRQAIKKIIKDVMEASPIKISCELDECIDDTVTDKFKVNILRIVQAQLNNILSHAKATEAAITLSQNQNFITLRVSDNGVGFDLNKKREGIGITNIKNRAASYDGVAHFVSQSGKGCVLTVTFPLQNEILKITA